MRFAGRGQRAPCAAGARDRMKLGGLKVIELSWFLPGPFLAMALADLGAEVIKVEPPAARAIPAATSRRWMRAPARFSAISTAARKAS